MTLLGSAAAFLLGGRWVGILFLVAGLVCLFVWHRWRPDEKRMLSWTDLESRLKELREKEIRYANANRGDGRLDATQCRGDDGRQRWMLLGSGRDVRREAEILFTLAGKMVRSAGFVRSPRVDREKDDMSRWMWFLVEFGQHTKDICTTGYTKETGQIETHTYWLHGVIDVVAPISAYVERAECESRPRRTLSVARRATLSES